MSVPLYQDGLRRHGTLRDTTKFGNYFWRCVRTYSETLARRNSFAPMADAAFSYSIPTDVPFVDRSKFYPLSFWANAGNRKAIMAKIRADSGSPPEHPPQQTKKQPKKQKQLHGRAMSRTSNTSAGTGIGDLDCFDDSDDNGDDDSACDSAYEPIGDRDLFGDGSGSEEDEQPVNIDEIPTIMRHQYDQHGRRKKRGTRKEQARRPTLKETAKGKLPRVHRVNSASTASLVSLASAGSTSSFSSGRTTVAVKRTRDALGYATDGEGDDLRASTGPIGQRPMKADEFAYSQKHKNTGARGPSCSHTRIQVMA